MLPYCPRRAWWFDRRQQLSVHKSRLVEGNAVFEPIAYYNREALMFPQMAQSFASTGALNPMDFYVILDWKSSRARTRHRSRLARLAGTFNAAVGQIGADLHGATGPEQQLGLLLIKWGFRLPTASAILTVIYPEKFTIYDIRVCNALDGFHQLGRMKWSPTAWAEYQMFMGAVRAAAPPGLSLRDCDRWLWGRDKHETLRNELVES
jgi:hypothetical protein